MNHGSVVGAATRDPIVNAAVVQLNSSWNSSINLAATAVYPVEPSNEILGSAVRP